MYVLQAKKDREAADAEDGWTVVVAKTGRKKTTDDSGIAVGAVSAEAAEDRGNKKRKKKENSALDFYRFQRHEARRNGECNLFSPVFDQSSLRYVGVTAKIWNLHVNGQIWSQSS